MPDRRPRATVTRSRIGWCVMPIAYAVMLASPSATLPRDDLGLRRFQTPAVGPTLTLGQTFQMPVDGLHAIELVPAASPVDGDVRFNLYETYPRSSAAPVRSGVMPAAMVRPPVLRFEFAPIEDSKERSYRLDILAASGRGPAFWATKGERYGLGAMHANGRERWADLSFGTDAPVPTIWRRLVMLRRTSPARAYVVMGALIALWVVVGLVVHAIETYPSAPDRLIRA